MSIDENIVNKLAIKRIKDIYFFVNEKLFVPNSNQPVKVELQNMIGANLDKNLVEFTLRIFLHYADSTIPKDLLADLQVQNVFEVSNLKDYAFENGLSFPPKLLIVLLGLSIDHGRALLAKNLAGTAFQEVILPITNPLIVAKHFYPTMFEEPPQAVSFHESKE